ncbi:MAG: lipoyl(octanoyl) transferase LipB [Calditrichae bacterium]|nr:lipoyl(octanoyl) transferase LipB [Calditrichia bacterium]
MQKSGTNETKQSPKALWLIDLGNCGYRQVWTFQQRLQRLRIEQRIPDVLIFVEHPPVYTIGKNGTENHVIAPSQFLNQQGIEVIPVDRGGDVTYHGPGQLVGYPIFDLHQHRKSVSFYMRQLEEVFIDVLKLWDITGERSDGYTGVWIRNEKIVALGVRISRWVTMHGFAFNIDPDLSHYNGIIPCGIFHMGVTSLSQQLGYSVELQDVKKHVVTSFLKLFEFAEVRNIAVDSDAVMTAPEAVADSLCSMQEMPNFIEQENMQ